MIDERIESKRTEHSMAAAVMRAIHFGIKWEKHFGYTYSFVVLFVSLFTAEKGGGTTKINSMCCSLLYV